MVYNENPFDNVIENGGFCSVMRVMGIIGDSLSSGEFAIKTETENINVDFFDYSWGKFMENATGNKIYNFSRGGMSAKEFINGYGVCTGAFDPHKAAHGYIIALGYNDLFGLRQKIGEKQDVDLENMEKNKEKDLFICNLAYIIQKYRIINNECKIFIMTMPKEYDDNAERVELKQKHAEAVYQLS